MKSINKPDFSSYNSPFNWRYASLEMRNIFSEKHKFMIWRKIWVALAKAQFEQGLITKKEYDDLKKNELKIDISRILEIEKETKHDVVAAIKEFAEKAKVGGGKIHLGATSMDINDNAEAYRVNQALELIENKIKNLIHLYSQKIKDFIDVPCIGYTHLQPAEPTTIGYRFAFYAQDLLIDFDFLKFIKSQFKAKGLKGAVGTAASYDELLNNQHQKNSRT